MTSRHRAVMLAAVSGLLMASAAQAFTYDSRTNQNSDGSARFRDPNHVAQDGMTVGNGRLSMKFSQSGMGNGYSNGYDARMVPSGNGAFTSSNEGPNAIDTALGNRHWPY